MPIRKQGHKQTLDGVILAHNHFAYFTADPFCDLRNSLRVLNFTHRVIPASDPLFPNHTASRPALLRQSPHRGLDLVFTDRLHLRYPAERRLFPGRHLFRE